MQARRGRLQSHRCVFGGRLVFAVPAVLAVQTRHVLQPQERPRPLGNASTVMDGSAHRPHVVILGGGFGGIAVAQRLERRLQPLDAHVTLVSRENFSLFTPMLPEVSSGALDVRHVVTPIRPQLRRTRFILRDVNALDVPAKLVTFTHTLTGATESIPYDYLVLALGSSTSTFNLPGVAQRVFALKTLEDAGILRNRFVWLLEL